MAQHTEQGGIVILTTHQPLNVAESNSPHFTTQRGPHDVLAHFRLELRVAFCYSAEIANAGSS
ncbi:hypothetical protein ACVXHA_03855 [Escherichia coli]